MNDMQNYYIQNQILTMPIKLRKEISKNNINFNKRSDYKNIIKYIDNYLEGNNINRFLVLPGLHDVGKTTLLYPLYEYLLKEKGISPQNMLYFSCHQLKKMGKVDIFNTVNYYIETYHNTTIDAVSYSIFFLVDETQYDKKIILLKLI